MNIFFYTTNRSDAAEHYLGQLQELSILNEMTTLPPGALFLSPFALKLRSGDLLLLFAANSEELDGLLALKKELVDFRIILILADSEAQRKAHSLYPCFIAFQGEKMMKLEAVIQKIMGADKNQTSNSPDQPLSSLPFSLFFLYFFALATNHSQHGNRAREIKVFTPSCHIATLRSLFAGVDPYFEMFLKKSALQLSLH